MAAVNAQVALDTARTLLNDDAGQFYTNTVLLPKLQEAFRILQAKLRVNSASIMIDIVTNNLAANTTAYPAVANLIEPIILWEKAQGALDSTYLKMTEFSPLPNVVPGATLGRWSWDGTQIQFIGSTSTRTVKLQYWASMTEPTGAGSSLVFINAEYYLGPMTAAIMAGSVGEAEIQAACEALADATLNDIINANRGRQAPPGSTRP